MSIDARRELALSWLRLAGEDLQSARKLSTPPGPIWNTAVYHCQQAAEKAAKALLALHGEDVPLKHDIGHILEKLKKHDPSLSRFEVTAERLTIFATDYRYPKPNTTPLTQEAVDEALRDAISIVEHIRALMPVSSEQDHGDPGGNDGDASGRGAQGGPQQGNPS